jgi:conjugal transfer pilus assembly protein TraW
MLKQREQSGELKRLEQAAVRRSVASAKSPKSVEGLARAAKRSVMTIDASLTIDKDIIDPLGNVVARAGTTVNPLHVMPFTQKLVFFDARDQEQVSAVKALSKASSKTVRPILVAGSWFDLAKAWQQTVYFDQEGKLCARFGITEVPAIVEQVGEQLVLVQLPAREMAK